MHTHNVHYLRGPGFAGRPLPFYCIYYRIGNQQSINSIAEVKNIM